LAVYDFRIPLPSIAGLARVISNVINRLTVSVQTFPSSRRHDRFSFHGPTERIDLDTFCLIFSIRLSLFVVGLLWGLSHWATLLPSSVKTSLACHSYLAASAILFGIVDSEVVLPRSAV
jgi:hypothetical protein